MADGVCCLPGCRSRKVLPSPLLSTPCAAPLGPCLQEADEAFGAIEYALGEQLAQLGDADPEFRQMWQDTLGDTRTSFLDMVSAGWVAAWIPGCLYCPDSWLHASVALDAVQGAWIVNTVRQVCSELGFLPDFLPPILPCTCCCCRCRTPSRCWMAAPCQTANRRWRGGWCT